MKDFISNPRNEPVVDNLVEKIFDLQKRNFSAFSLLVKDQKTKRNKKGNSTDFSYYEQKIAQTYQNKHPSRLNNLWE